jgi:hypothetical protein
MIKLVSIFSLKPNVDSDEACKAWREEHPSWLKDKMLPEAERYTNNRLMQKYPPAGGSTTEFDIFGYEMLWFDNLESALATAEQMRSAQPDAFLADFVKTWKMVIVKGENIKL